MNVLKRALLDRKLKKALAACKCRLDSGSRGLRNGIELTLEEGVKLHDVKLFGQRLTIGAHTDIMSGAELHEVSEIGRYCSIAAGTVIGHSRQSHPLNWLSTHSKLFALRAARSHEAAGYYLSTPATLGHDVWIGRDAMIMDGISIGTGAVVGAQSLVNKDVPPYAIVAGTPAKVIRYRFDADTIAQLLASQWWELPPERLAELPMEQPQALLEALAGTPSRTLVPRRVRLHSAPLRIEPL
jgi:acetyltransferase-like isoleucine patch superfamily enzyme